MPRLFVAIDLPEPVIKALESLSYGVPGARWSTPEQIHLTIRFIGDVDGTAGNDIADALTALESEPFAIRLQGVGHFPTRGEPKVLWVGVEKNAALLQFHRNVERTLTALERPLPLRKERRKFAPHITLARLHQTPVDRVGRFIAENNLFKTASFNIEEFHLYSSQLNPKGAIYTREYTYPLAQKSNMTFREKWKRGLI